MYFFNLKKLREYNVIWNSPQVYSLCYHKMSWLKPKSVENYTEEPFGDEMLNFDICGTLFKELFKDIDVLDVDAKTEIAASSENSGRKSTENEQNKRKRSIVIQKDDEIEEFQSKQVAKNTVKGTEGAVRRLEAWYNDRYGKKLCCQESTELMQATYWSIFSGNTRHKKR